MQRMTHLVCECELVVERVVVVQKHVRMWVSACGICAGALALVLVYVYPAIVEALAEHIEIILTEHGKSLETGGLCFIKCYGLLVALDYGHIDVVHVELVYAHELLS